MVMGAAGFALTYASVLWVGWMFSGLVMAGAGMGCGGMMAVAIMADLVDELETRTGNRDEGAFAALLNFRLKSGIAVSTALGGLMLAGAGFVANQAQSPATIHAIRMFFAIVPAAGFLAGAAVFARFAVTERVRFPDRMAELS